MICAASGQTGWDGIRASLRRARSSSWWQQGCSAPAARCYPVLAPLSRGYPRLEGRLSTCYSPVRRSTRRPKPTFALDLHVLGTPPAFVLSQDQTLEFDSYAYRTEKRNGHRRASPTGFFWSLKGNPSSLRSSRQKDLQTQTFKLLLVSPSLVKDPPPRL